MGLNLFRKLRDAAGVGQDDVRSMFVKILEDLRSQKLGSAMRDGAVRAIRTTLRELVTAGVVEESTAKSMDKEIREFQECGGP